MHIIYAPHQVDLIIMETKQRCSCLRYIRGIHILFRGDRTVHDNIKDRLILSSQIKGETLGGSTIR